MVDTRRSVVEDDDVHGMHRVDVWLLHEDAWPIDDSILTADEHAIVERYRFEDDRRRTAAGRTLLRQLLAPRVGAAPEALRFVTGEYGKPSVIESRIEFNVTHSGAWIGIAIGDAPVGIDVEEIKPHRDIEGLGRRYFLPHERQWIAAQSDPVRAFFRMWSMKEAVLKADGRGLALPLSDVSIHPAERFGTVPEQRWELTELEFDRGYAGCVATREGVRVAIAGAPSRGTRPDTPTTDN